MDQLFHLDNATFRKHWNLLVRTYYGIRTEQEQRVYEKNLLKFTALKYAYNVCKRHNGQGEPNPRTEELALAFLDGKAPGYFV